MNILIVIPARWGSTRFPGKPLALIAGKTMLQRVYEIAKIASKEVHADVLVATDDTRIAGHAKQMQAQVVFTPEDCPTGTDRAFAAASQLDTKPDFVINLQGDAPLTPPWFIERMIAEYHRDPSVDVVTPVTQLNWNGFERLRENKKTTPFSGTTALLKPNGDAYWFSKNIVPAIRKEDYSQPPSPVFQHIGLYGYRYDMLEKYASLVQTPYEQLEGLEQLRVIEHGYNIRCVKVDYRGRPSSPGVDSPQDVTRVEQLIAQYGEFTL